MGSVWVDKLHNGSRMLRCYLAHDGWGEGPVYLVTQNGKVVWAGEAARREKIEIQLNDFAEQYEQLFLVHLHRMEGGARQATIYLIPPFPETGDAPILACFRQGDSLQRLARLFNSVASWLNCGSPDAPAPGAGEPRENMAQRT